MKIANTRQYTFYTLYYMYSYTTASAAYLLYPFRGVVFALGDQSADDYMAIIKIMIIIITYWATTIVKTVNTAIIYMYII